MITKAQPFVFSKKIQDVAFIEEYPGVPPRDSLGRNGRSLHIVVSGGENDESSLCVPFSKMYEFVKK